MNIRERAEKARRAIWLACQEAVAKDVSEIIRDLLAECERLEKEKQDNHGRAEEIIKAREQHIRLLQEENAYVNDMLENAHNRSSNLELRIAEAIRQTAEGCLEIVELHEGLGLATSGIRSKYLKEGSDE